MTAVVRGDALHIPLADASVDLIVTSPPYYALRSYRDGGEHYDGQVGSEPTPQAFLEALWAVTAECWRVLKPSGSMFVNLGDTRSGSGGPGGDYNDGGLKAGRPRSRRQSIGRPSLWTNQNAAWLAGVIDCDGSISVRRNVVPEGRSPSFVPWVRVAQVTNEVVDRCAEITGVGQVYRDGRGVWNWNASAQQTAYVLERIWPWLRIKQRQALAVIALARNIAENDNGRRVERNTIAWRLSVKEAVQAWNKGRPAWLSVPTPEKIILPDRESRPRRKSKMLLPHRYAAGCLDGLADPDGIGWIVRQDMVWNKPNGLPESVTDRTRDSHEYWFHMTKQERYFSAVDEIRESSEMRSGSNGAARDVHTTEGSYKWNPSANSYNPLGKLPGSVWTVASEPLSIPEWLGVDHFAAFPQEWPRRLILGWSPSGICAVCGEGRRPVVAKGGTDEGKALASSRHPAHADTYESAGVWGAQTAEYAAARRLSGPELARHSTTDTITGYACACPTPNAPTRPAVILDPFGGTGTVALVARALGRTGISLDLSADYSRLAQWRIFRSGHASKTRQRTNSERQGTLL